MGEGSERTAFVGREDAVRRATVLEQAERHDHSANRLQAMAEIGSLLGYPTCCTAAYLQQDDQGETASFERLIQTGPTSGLPEANNLFVLSHQLISHFPCSLDCKASAAVGQRALEILSCTSPTHGDALMKLLRSPIVVWDRFRILVEHPDEGLVAADRLSHEPRLLDHPGFRAFHDALPEIPRGGERLCFDRESGP